MSTRSIRDRARALYSVSALRTMLAGGACAVVASTSLAASTPPATPGAARSAASRASAADVGESVRSAITEARDAIAEAQIVAQIEFDDLAADTAALAFIGNELGGVREIVKNAPYSAEAVTESVQVLGDGNRIVRKTTTLLARDGVGRTRQETGSERGATIYISDPIEGRSYALNPERKTAVRIPRVPAPPVPPVALMPPTAPTPPMAPLPPLPPIQPGTPLTATPPGTPSAGTTFTAPMPSSAAGADVRVQPGQVIVRKHADGASPGDEVRVEVIRMGRGDGRHAMPGMHAAAWPFLPRAKGETKALGTREFEGVRADGTQTTQTIPAGAIGNEKPIVVATERWFSPELNVVVYARTSDPRVGETTYRLANLKRIEPPADRFKVPADYRVRGEPRRGS